MRKVLIFGPRLKSEMTGLALAVELLINGLCKSKIPFIFVDTTFFNKKSKSGAFSGIRAVETIIAILRVWISLPICSVYYTTISTSVFGFFRDFLTVVIAKFFRKRVVLHLHGGGFENFYENQPSLVQGLVRLNLKYADRIIVLGELLKEQFYCAGDFVRPKLVVVPNGLTIGIDEPEVLERDLSYDKPLQLLYLSSLMPSKGFLDVIKAMRFLGDVESNPFHLHLCGAFVDASTEVDREICNEDQLRNYLKAHKLENTVTYHGQVTGSEKEARFIDASLFLLPTNYPWEGQPLSIIEALAFSIPVISCFHKGIPEQIDDGVCGRLVPSASPPAIAKAVLEICSSEESYKKYSRAARKKYETDFTREKHLEKLIGVIFE